MMFEIAINKAIPVLPAGIALAELKLKKTKQP